MEIVAGAANFQKMENWQMYLKRVILTKSQVDSSQTTNKQTDRKKKKINYEEVTNIRIVTDVTIDGTNRCYRSRHRKHFA